MKPSDQNQTQQGLGIACSSPVVVAMSTHSRQTDCIHDKEEDEIPFEDPRPRLNTEAEKPSNFNESDILNKTTTRMTFYDSDEYSNLDMSQRFEAKKDYDKQKETEESNKDNQTYNFRSRNEIKPPERINDFETD